MIKRTERGWAGHFIRAMQCHFRRNTLLESGATRIVVSTVGRYLSDLPNGSGKYQQIGYKRYAETMAFWAMKDGQYWDADVSKEYSFDSPWTLDSLDDQVANDMHEAVVEEIMLKLEREAT